MDSMTEGTDEESDGQDDSEFLPEHQKYVDYVETRTFDLLKAEQERETVPFPPTSLLVGEMLT